jgi:hypothetical protein
LRAVIIVVVVASVIVIVIVIAVVDECAKNVRAWYGTIGRARVVVCRRERSIIMIPN